MVAFAPAPNVKRWLPSLPTGGGVLAGLGTAMGIAVLPIEALEQMVWSTGIAALIPAAQPPLGFTARLCVALGSGIAIGAVCWALLFLAFGPGGFLARAVRADVPLVRRGDAHPDAPPRRPMTAADLGTPFMDVTPPPAAPPPPPVVQPLPADLDQPLAAFDPAALPATPREPSRPLAALAPGERIETFTLAPPPAPTVAPTRRDPAAPPSIDSLLRRLEEGAMRRPRAA